MGIVQGFALAIRIGTMRGPAVNIEHVLISWCCACIWLQAMTARGSRPVADHESVTSVISRMMAAEEEMGEEGGREITAGGAAPMPDPHAGVQGARLCC
jgi:hypothetical protein